MNPMNQTLSSKGGEGIRSGSKHHADAISVSQIGACDFPILQGGKLLSANESNHQLILDGCPP